MNLEPTPSTSQFVDVDNLSFHYLDFGDTRLAPGKDPRMTMLCLHGGAAQAHWFDFVVGPFLDNYRVLSLDLRGHGDSDWGPPDKYSYPDFARDVGGFIQKLGIGPVLLVGHSMGGLLARQYIQHKGGDRRVKSLTTLGTPHHGTPTALVGLGVTGLGLISDSASQMLPGSRFLKRLQRTPWPAQIPLTSVYSRHDMVCPSWCSTLRPRPGESSMENRPVRSIGHTGLCHDPGVYRIVRTELEKAARLWNERDGLHEP